jgi:hypothetical protein
MLAEKLNGEWKIENGQIQNPSKTDGINLFRVWFAYTRKWKYRNVPRIRIV